MKITGHEISEAIGLWQMRLDGLNSAFADSLMAYPDDKKEKPEVLGEGVAKCERAIARLQSLQTEFNMKVTVEIPGKVRETDPVTLCEAVKIRGGALRVRDMWKQAASIDGPRRRSWRNDEVRTTETIVAKATIGHDLALNLAIEAAKFAKRVQSAISLGNSYILEIGNENDEALLEGPS